MRDALERAAGEVLGALTYGKLRSFAATARLIETAPDAATAGTAAAFADDEYDAYRQLHDALDARTCEVAAVLDRQKPHFDDFFSRAPLGDWAGACTFFALGVPLAGDFAETLAPVFDPQTAAVVREAFTAARVCEQFAVEQLTSRFDGEAVRVRARQGAADLLGRALTSYQQVADSTDALDVLLTAQDPRGGPQRATQLAMAVLDGHRRRMVALGLEEVDDDL